MTMMPLLKGHPVSLAVLDYGLFRVNSNGRVIGICGYLVRTSADEHVLIDTGFPSKYTEDYRPRMMIAVRFRDCLHWCEFAQCGQLC